MSEISIIRKNSLRTCIISRYYHKVIQSLEQNTTSPSLSHLLEFTYHCKPPCVQILKTNTCKTRRHVFKGKHVLSVISNCTFQSYGFLLIGFRYHRFKHLLNLIIHLRLLRNLVAEKRSNAKETIHSNDNTLLCALSRSFRKRA